MRTAVFLVLVGCGGTIDPVADIVFDPCADVRIAVDGPADRMAGIEAALASWQAHGFLAGATVDPAGTMRVVFEEAAPNMHGLYDDEHGIVYLNLDLSNDEIAVVAAHELGHAIGLPHIDDRPSVMRRGNLEILPTPEDANDLASIWGACPAPRGPLTLP